MEADSESIAVTRFLQVIGETHQHLQELARGLRSLPEVKTVQVYPFMPGDMTQHHWDEEQRQAAIGSEFGVSVELYDGAVLDWWVTVRCQKSGWYLTASILRSDRNEDGCHKVAEFGEQHSLTFKTAMKQLSDAAAWLVVSEVTVILLGSSSS